MASPEDLNMQIPFKKTKEGILIEVKVEPRSSKKGIGGLMDNVLKVKLTAPPVDNEANKQLIEIISELLGIRKSSIRIIKGLTSKKKILEIKGIEKI